MDGSQSSYHSPMQSGSAHLAVLHHGLWGSCRDLYFVEARLLESGWLVLNSTCNSERFTYDGIDVCGDRLVRETRSCCARLLSKGIRVSKVSFIGYSLGGLVVRYAIGKLQATGFFTEVRPVNVVTFASPHLGAYRQPGATATERLCNIVLPWTLSRTGAQLVLGDNFLGGLPLLFVMAHPQYAFMEALHCFENRILLVNVKGDTTVPFFSAAMSELNPFERAPGPPLSAKYPCIINNELINFRNLLAPSTAEELPPNSNYKIVTSQLQSSTPSPTASQSPLNLPRINQDFGGGLGLNAGSVTHKRRNSRAWGGVLQPQLQQSTPLQAVKPGSRVGQFHTSMGRLLIQDQSFQLRQAPVFPTSHHRNMLFLSQTHIGSSYGHNSRQIQLAYRQPANQTHTTTAYGAVGIVTRSARSDRKLGRLDSTSFLLLLPLFLMVWLFMVALLTLWGVRHYLTRLSVGITRDRSWPVHVLLDSATEVAGDRSGSGGGSSRTQMSSAEGSTPRPSMNATSLLQLGSSGTLQARGIHSSNGSCISDSGAGSRISHTSDDLSGDECDSPSLTNIADEIRGMTSACGLALGHLAAAVERTVLHATCTGTSPNASVCHARTHVCSDDGSTLDTLSASLTQSGHASLGGHKLERHSVLLQRAIQQQQQQHQQHQHKHKQQQPWLWPAETNLLSHPCKVIRSTSAVLVQSGEVERHACRCNEQGSEVSVLPVACQLCKQNTLSMDSITGFPSKESGGTSLTHAHRHTGDSSMPNSGCICSSCSLAASFKPCEDVDSSGRLDTSPSRDPDRFNEVQVCETSLVCSLPSVSSNASGSHPPLKRKSQSCSRKGLSVCGVPAQFDQSCESSVAATCSRSAFVDEECSILQQSQSEGSSSGSEEAYSSRRCIVDHAAAGIHVHACSSTGVRGDLPLLCAAEGLALHSRKPRVCLAHPLPITSQPPRHAPALWTPSHSQHSHLLMNRIASHTSVCLSSRPFDRLILSALISEIDTGDIQTTTSDLTREAASEIVGASMTTTTTSTTATLITSSASAARRSWLVLASPASSFAVLKSGSFKISSFWFSKLFPDPEPNYLGPALRLTRREWQDVMMENMNNLGWQKIHVDTHHYHAHAAIVVRSYRRFPAQEHIVEYMVTQMRL